MFSCKPACCGKQDPVTDKVKVDLSLLQAEKENTKPMQVKQKEEEDKKLAHQQQKEEERRQAEEQARRKRQAEEERRLREEQEAKERMVREEAERKAAAARAAAEAEAKEQRRLKAERDFMEAQERANQERERLAQEQVNKWCKTNNFPDMNTSKKSFMGGTRFPIHEAVTKNEAEIVGLMLQLGVDKSVKTSKGKTAMDIAHKLNKNGSMDATLSKLNGNFP